MVDQISKVYVKTNFSLYETIHVFGLDSAQIHFVENDGAAWGFELNNIFTFLSKTQGKIILTVFRLFAILAIGYWLYNNIKKGKASGYFITAVALIFAGAFGNIIDSVLYGVIFDESTPNTIAQAFPKNGAYGTLFYGRVVDMLYFPIWKGELFGKPFTFFNAIFNIADMAISTGIGILLVFNKKAFK